jgi:hypothetical protein
MKGNGVVHMEALNYMDVMVKMARKLKHARKLKTNL